MLSTSWNNKTKLSHADVNCQGQVSVITSQSHSNLCQYLKSDRNLGQNEYKHAYVCHSGSKDSLWHFDILYQFSFV